MTKSQSVKKKRIQKKSGDSGGEDDDMDDAMIDKGEEPSGILESGEQESLETHTKTPEDSTENVPWELWEHVSFLKDSRPARKY